MCARCLEGYFLQSDDTCAPCVDLGDDGTNRAGDQNQAFLYYGVMSGLAAAIAGFLLHLYLRRDTGSHFVSRLRRCAGCAKRSKTKIHSEGLSRANTSHDDYANEQRSSMWFRPEKFKILLAFVQIFSQMKNNYGVPWSSNTAEYMRGFQGFNIDIVKIAAVDCLYRTNFYFGLIVVFAVPCAGVLFIFLIHRCGRLHWMNKIKGMPRKCVRSGVDVVSWMPAKEYLRLRHESAKKSLLADAIPDDEQSIGNSDAASKKEEKKAMKEQMGNLTGIPPGSAIADKFYNSKAIIDSAHLTEVLEHNRNIWKNRLVERMEYMRYTNKCWKLLFWMMLLGYPSVSVKTLRTFSCVQVGQYRVLAQDMGIQCSGSTYWMYVLVAAIAGGTVIIGVPLTFIIALIRARDKGVSKIWRACLRFPDRQERLLKEAKEDARASGFFWTMDKDGDGQTTLVEKRNAIKAYLRRKNMRFHRTYQRLGFIYYSYTEECWWYEVVELSRKLVLNGLMVLVSDNNASTRVVAGVGACFVYLLVMNYFRPYKCASDFLLQNVCHVQLFLTVLCGLLLKAEVPFLGFEPRWRPTERHIIEVVIISSHLLTCIFAVGTVIWEKFFSSEVRRVQARRAKATIDRKKRMAKWGRAKKAVLMGVRGSIGLKSFGGKSFGGTMASRGSGDTKGGGGVSGIISALSKGTGSNTKVAPKKKTVVTEGFLAAARERAALEVESREEGVSDAQDEEVHLPIEGAFAFPDDERDFDSTKDANKQGGRDPGVETSASEPGETSADDSDSSDEDNNRKPIMSTKKMGKLIGSDNDQSTDTDSSEGEDALAAAIQRNNDNNQDVGKKTESVEDSNPTDEAPVSEDEEEVVHAENKAAAETSPAEKQLDVAKEVSDSESSLAGPGSDIVKLSVEEEMASIKKEAAIAADAAKLADNNVETRRMNDKNKQKRTALSQKDSGGADFAWDDVSDSDGSSSTSIEDVSSDDE